MKKLLFAALLSLAGVGLSTGPAAAGWLFCHHCCAGSASLCVRPYNAFSPSVFGSITADGCFPIQFTNHGCNAPGGYGAPWGGPGCGADGCPGCVAGGVPSGQVIAAPTMLPPGTVPTFQGPVPQGVPTTAVPMGPSPVQATGYGPMPGMQPTSYPAYWGGANPYAR